MDIVIIGILILINGLFSMSEMALISAKKSKLSNDIKRGSKSAQLALNLANEPDLFLSTIQIGITLMGILTGIYSGDVLAKDCVLFLKEMGFTHEYVFWGVQGGIVIFVTYLSLVFGELLPKRIGMGFAENISKIMVRPILGVSYIASPFVWILSQSTAFIFQTLRLKSTDNKITEEEIRSLIQEGAQDGVVDVMEQNIVSRVFSLGDRNVVSIMTHRSELIWLDSLQPICDIKAKVYENLHNVYPVAEGSLDNVMGVVFLKDLFLHWEHPHFNIKKIIRSAQFFHEDMGVYKILEYFKVHGSAYGLVSDEFGSVQGMVTFMDILEGLVGEVSVKNEGKEIVESSQGGWFIDGQCSFYNFMNYFNLEEFYSEYEYNTLSGLVLSSLEHIPEVGETFFWRDFFIEIVDMDGARIDKILVRKNKEEGNI